MKTGSGQSPEQTPKASLPPTSKLKAVYSTQGSPAYLDEAKSQALPQTHMLSRNLKVHPWDWSAVMPTLNGKQTQEAGQPSLTICHLP